MIRIAALADVHFGLDAAGTLRPHLAHLNEQADLLLLAGDVTRIGDPEEAELFIREIDGIAIPSVAVLGNHDHHSDRADDIAALLEGRGTTVLDGEGTTIDVDGVRVGIAGVKGFGGGFVGASGSDFGEREMKGFIRHTKDRADRLEKALGDLRCDLKIALLHYAPVPDTLAGERLEIYPFLGCYLFADAIDRAGADLVIHGHAHAGCERGVTPGGIPVRNVAHSVIRRAYALYEFDTIGGPPIDAHQPDFVGWRYLAH